MNKVINNMMSYLKRGHHNIYVIYAAVIFFIYFPLISEHFIMTDDYAMLDVAIHHSKTLLEWDIKNGRPIYGLFQYFLQCFMMTVPAFSWLRFFSIISTIVLCCFLHHFLSSKAKIKSKNFALYIPLFIVFVPAIVVYNAWASCFVYVTSILLSGLAYYCMFDENRKTTIGRFIIGLTFLICAFFIYQPTAMLFLYFVFLNTCIDTREINFSNLVISAVALMISMFVSLLSIKLLPKIIYGYAIERSNLNTGFISKFNWFLNKPLRMVIKNYNIHPGILYIVISILVIMLGCFYIFKQRQGFLKILLTLLLMVAIMAPALLAKENWLATRSSVGLYFIITTIMFYSLINIYEKFLSQYNVKIILGCMLFVICIYTQHYIYSGFIRQQQAEYQALTQEIVSVVPKDYTGLVRFDISNPLESAFTKISLSDEIGHTSIQIPWAIRGVAQSIKELKGLNFKVDNSSLILGPDESCKNNCIIIHSSDALRKAQNYK